jgi:hypothetical protein
LTEVLAGRLLELAVLQAGEVKSRTLASTPVGVAAPAFTGWPVPHYAPTPDRSTNNKPSAGSDIKAEVLKEIFERSAWNQLCM